MLSNRANDFQYLFLGGIIGEVLSLPFVGDYLKINKKILADLGVETITCKTLNSYRTAEENAKTLKMLIEELHRTHRKPLIIFGHSKACLELMLGLMDHLEVFKAHVKQVICVQPPFQGSSVFERYDFLKLINPIWPGLNCLMPKHYTNHFNELVQNKEVQNYLRDSVLVIRGYRPQSREVSWIIRPSHFLMKRSGHDNDGLVKLKDQSIPFAEYREILMDLDHSDLFTSRKLSTRDDEFRRRLMVELIQHVLDKNTSDPLPRAEDSGSHEHRTLPSWDQTVVG